jgi:hypothetical protein
VITPRGLFGPLLLIAIGLVFLLVNFGYVPGVTAVQLLSLWPLLLILAGVDLAIGRRWPLAALGVGVAVIALGLALLVTQPTAFGSPFFFDRDDDRAPGQRDLTVERRSVTSLSLEINGGAGRFSVSGGSTMLVETHSPNEDLRLRRADYDKGGEHADVRIEHTGTRRVGGVTANVETRIASNVPTDLEINGGAGEFIIDLSDVTISNAEINVGAATLTLTLPKPTLATAGPSTKPVGEIKIELNAGASSIVIEVPEGVEARITTTGALLTLRSSNPRVNASANAAETSGYASSQQRVTVQVTAGASSVTVR